MNGFQFKSIISAEDAASTCCSPTAKNNSRPPRQRSTQCCSLRQYNMAINAEDLAMLQICEAPQHQHPKRTAPERDARCAAHRGEREGETAIYVIIVARVAIG